MSLKGLLLAVVLVPYVYPADSTNIYEPSGASFGIENDFTNQYIWHGISYNKGLLNQPAAWISIYGFTFYTWGNITVHDNNSSIKRHEVDFILEYYWEAKDWKIEPSLSYYIYPGQEDSPPTSEANLKLSYKVSPLEFYTILNLDIMEYPGSFRNNLGVMSEIILNDELNLNIDINAGLASQKFNETYIDIYFSQNSFNYLNCSLSLNYYLTESIYIKPHLEYYSILSSALRSISGNYLVNFGLAAGVEL